MQKLIYSILFIVGVFGAFWLFSSNNHDTKQELNTTKLNTLVKPNIQVSDVNVTHDIKTNALTTNENNCDKNCIENIDQLRLQLELTDEKYEALLNHTDELVIYLQKNPNLLTEFIELATTSSSDHRNIIMTAFNQLDLNARSALGEALIESSDWQSRFDGISFLAQTDIMNEQLVQQFSDMLPAEADDYVRSNIVKAFNQPDKFYGNQEILNTLEEVKYSDDNDTVRGEALIARVQLEQDPEVVFHDTFSAIRSDEPEYRDYGLRALDKIVTRKLLNGSEISWEYKDEAEYLFDELRGTKYDNMPVDFLNMVDDLFKRIYENEPI